MMKALVMGRAWSADKELELACKVGSLADFQRALAEGADVNADGGTPMFVAIMKGNGEMVRLLVEAGADPGLFLRKSRMSRLKTTEQIVAALMEGVPPPVPETDCPPADDDDEFGAEAAPPSRSKVQTRSLVGGKRPAASRRKQVRRPAGLESATFD
jgi:ankyrin repeat protein